MTHLVLLLLILFGPFGAVGIPALVASLSWPGVLTETARPRRAGMAVARC